MHNLVLHIPQCFGCNFCSDTCLYLSVRHNSLCVILFQVYLISDVSFRVRRNLRLHAGDVDAAAVPCGLGRAFGNKVCLPFAAILIC